MAAKLLRAFASRANEPINLGGAKHRETKNGKHYYYRAIDKHWFIIVKTATGFSITEYDGDCGC